MASVFAAAAPSRPLFESSAVMVPSDHVPPRLAATLRVAAGRTDHITGGSSVLKPASGTPAEMRSAPLGSHSYPIPGVLTLNYPVPDTAESRELMNIIHETRESAKSSAGAEWKSGSPVPKAAASSSSSSKQQSADSNQSWIAGPFNASPAHAFWMRMVPGYEPLCNTAEEASAYFDRYCLGGNPEDKKGTIWGAGSVQGLTGMMPLLQALIKEGENHLVLQILSSIATHAWFILNCRVLRYVGTRSAAALSEYEFDGTKPPYLYLTYTLQDHSGVAHLSDAKWYDKYTGNLKRSARLLTIPDFAAVVVRELTNRFAAKLTAESSPQLRAFVNASPSKFFASAVKNGVAKDVLQMHATQMRAEIVSGGNKSPNGIDTHANLLLGWAKRMKNVHSSMAWVEKVSKFKKHMTIDFLCRQNGAASIARAKCTSPQTRVADLLIPQFLAAHNGPEPLWDIVVPTEKPERPEALASYWSCIVKACSRFIASGKNFLRKADQIAHKSLLAQLGDAAPPLMSEAAAARWGGGGGGGGGDVDGGEDVPAPVDEGEDGLLPPPPDEDDESERLSTSMSQYGLGGAFRPLFFENQPTFALANRHGMCSTTSPREMLYNVDTMEYQWIGPLRGAVASEPLQTLLPVNERGLEGYTTAFIAFALTRGVNRVKQVAVSSPGTTFAADATTWRFDTRGPVCTASNVSSTYVDFIISVGMSTLSGVHYSKLPSEESKQVYLMRVWRALSWLLRNDNDVIRTLCEELGLVEQGHVAIANLFRRTARAHLESEPERLASAIALYPGVESALKNIANAWKGVATLPVAINNETNGFGMCSFGEECATKLSETRPIASVWVVESDGASAPPRQLLDPVTPTVVLNEVAAMVTSLVVTCRLPPHSAYVALEKKVFATDGAGVMKGVVPNGNRLRLGMTNASKVKIRNTNAGCKPGDPFSLEQYMTYLYRMLFTEVWLPMVTRISTACAPPAILYGTSSGPQHWAVLTARVPLRAEKVGNALWRHNMQAVLNEIPAFLALFRSRRPINGELRVALEAVRTMVHHLLATCGALDPSRRKALENFRKAYEESSILVGEVGLSTRFASPTALHIKETVRTRLARTHMLVGSKLHANLCEKFVHDLTCDKSHHQRDRGGEERMVDILAELWVEKKTDCASLKKELDAIVALKASDPTCASHVVAKMCLGLIESGAWPAPGAAAPAPPPPAAVAASPAAVLVSPPSPTKLTTANLRAVVESLNAVAAAAPPPPPPPPLEEKKARPAPAKVAKATEEEEKEKKKKKEIVKPVAETLAPPRPSAAASAPAAAVPTAAPAKSAKRKTMAESSAAPELGETKRTGPPASPEKKSKVAAAAAAAPAPPAPVPATGPLIREVTPSAFTAPPTSSDVKTAAEERAKARAAAAAALKKAKADKAAAATAATPAPPPPTKPSVPDIEDEDTVPLATTDGVRWVAGAQPPPPPTAPAAEDEEATSPRKGLEVQEEAD